MDFEMRPCKMALRHRRDVSGLLRAPDRERQGGFSPLLEETRVDLDLGQRRFFLLCRFSRGLAADAGEPCICALNRAVDDGGDLAHHVQALARERQHAVRATDFLAAALAAFVPRGGGPRGKLPSLRDGEQLRAHDLRCVLGQRAARVPGYAGHDALQGLPDFAGVLLHLGRDGADLVVFASRHAYVARLLVGVRAARVAYGGFVLVEQQFERVHHRVDVLGCAAEQLQTHLQRLEGGVGQRDAEAGSRHYELRGPVYAAVLGGLRAFLLGLLFPRRGVHCDDGGFFVLGRAVVIVCGEGFGVGGL